MAEEKCSDKHDTLYHYTTVEGFLGIVKTQNLWATHYEHLNDSSELARFKDALAKFLVPTAKKVIKSSRAKGKTYKAEIRELGSRDALAKHEANALSNSLFDAAFKPTGDRETPMFEPFITSFCSLRKDDRYTRDNGLLSMWRSYGADGGVALLMDTATLEGCLARESEEYGYSILQIGDVVYEGEIEEFHSEFGPLIKIATDVAHRVFSGEGTSVGEFLEPYLQSVARLKHQGFKEEREVRIVAMPWQEQNLEQTPGTTKKIKQEQVRRGRKGSIRYLSLLDGDGAPRLPIRKIIVGPHADQEQRYKEIRQATKHLEDVEVTCSETPYLAV